MTRRRWTADELRLLREWREAGDLYRSIARRLGRREDVVASKGRELRLMVAAPARIKAVELLGLEIEAARRERATAPLFRPGDRV